jgi:hypothetical protein
MAGKPRYDLTKQVFGKLTVLSRSSLKGKHHQAKWVCRCECGRKTTVFQHSLLGGRAKSCGCGMHPKGNKAPNKIDMLKQTFGRLTVVAAAQPVNNQAKWVCQCICGNVCVVVGNRLRNGKTQSCGCLRKAAYAWKGYEEISGNFWTRLQRIAAARNLPFTITVQQAWRLFLRQERKCALSGVSLTFRRSQADRTRPQTASLDRIDSKKGYTPRNIQWVHKTVNLMKNVLSQSEFVGWCKHIAHHQSS